MIYLPETATHSRTLAKRVERGTLVRLARGIYSDDPETPPKEQILKAAIPIAARLYKDAYISHSSAATRAPVNGILFMSQPGGKKSTHTIPGLRIVRLPALPHPETERIEVTPETVRTRDDLPSTTAVSVSTALQTVFECMGRTRQYPEKRLSDATLANLIGSLSNNDKRRAPAFAARNHLSRELVRFEELLTATDRKVSVHTKGLRQFELHFYNWHVGTLTALSNAEFRFEYNQQWTFELSKELPIQRDGIAYEGPRMPAFFENFLPEGWTENRLQKTYHLDPADTVGLLATTQKYLSNLTLRPLSIPAGELRFDAHQTRLHDLAPDPASVINAQERIEHDPETATFWKELRARGAVGLSGIQPKLPVSLTLESGSPVVRIGDLKTPCTHILKFQSPHYQSLVENEWATMELARRVGLNTAPVRLIRFGDTSPFRGNALIIERFDIPLQSELDSEPFNIELMMQEDACSLLLLSRKDKYKTSYERIASALVDSGLSTEPAQRGLWRLIEHVALSWLIGNGDLHAKNISIIKRIKAGAFGDWPRMSRIEYSPLYDLLNTTLAIPDDDFAITVNGKRNDIKLRDIASVVERWKGSRKRADDLIDKCASGVRAHLSDVLSNSHLPTELSERYFKQTDVRLREFGA